ncbi:MAG: rluB [Acidimicrobiaceae bacterium]|nr:rluB [Acidimicrobiaceae bacterium]
MSPSASPTDAEGERLQKVLARAGYGSRRACDDLIAGGRVTVNGRVAELGRRVLAGRDTVAVDGVPVGILPDLVYYLLNKPDGVVTTAQDPEGRPTVLELVPQEPRVFPVGRLDYATEGLLLLTNDGEWANLLAHPSHGVEKEYLAELVADPSPGALRKLRVGVDLGAGLISAPARVSRVGPALIRVVIHEGRYRQVRRMCEEVGFPVRRLARTRIGTLRDTRLAPGAWRPLTTDEVRALGEAAVRPAGANASRAERRAAARRSEELLGPDDPDPDDSPSSSPERRDG